MFLNADDIVRRIDELIQLRRPSGALCTYALVPSAKEVHSEPEINLLAEPELLRFYTPPASTVESMRDTIVSCRVLFSTEVLKPRESRDYGSLRLLEEWVDAGDIAAHLAAEFDTQERPRIGVLHIRLDSLMPTIVPMVTGKPKKKRSELLIMTETRSVSRKPLAWSCWEFSGSLSKTDVLPLLGKLIRPPLPPYDSSLAAISDWFDGAARSHADEHRAPAVWWSGEVYIVFPDTRGRMVAATWSDRHVHIMAEGKDLTVQLTGARPQNRERYVATHLAEPIIDIEIPADIASVQLYMTTGGELLSELKLMPQALPTPQPRVESVADPVVAHGKGEHRVRLFHISDLHARGSREGAERWRRRRVLGDAWERNLDELLEEGPIDLIAFTGDLADWGVTGEYDEVAEFIDALLERTRVPVERLFVVPGNHDVQRAVEREAWELLRGLVGRLEHLELARWVDGGSVPRGVEPTLLERVALRMSAYRTFITKTLKRPELVPQAPGNLGWRTTIRLEQKAQPFDIHLVGLDSAWCCGDDSDAGKLCVGTSQIGRLLDDGQGRALTGWRIALVHHPLTDLRSDDARQCRALLADKADLLLRGHLHDPEVAEHFDPDRAFRQLAAGCLYEGHAADTYPNACHLIDATLTSSGRPLRYDVLFRSWSQRGFWHSDNSLYRDARGGRLTWKIE